MEKRFTPDNIQELKENEIFVFGSNLAGKHEAGAAKTAMDKFGAKYGIGIGKTGQCYAIPTKDHNIKTLPIEEIKPFIDELFNYIQFNENKIFYITQIGCGLAGYTVKEIAPLFKKFEILPNAILPEVFINYKEMKKLLVYKMTDENMKCRNMQYELNKTYRMDGKIIICNKGYHSCSTPINCLNYYDNNRKNRLFLCEIELNGSESFNDNENINNFTKIATNNIIFLQEIVNLNSVFNIGDSNTGDRNTGNWNTGDWNTGNRNTGDRNTGDWNTGNRNTGDWNIGNRNTGNRNTGDRNKGNWNTGDWNTGNWNTGNSNTGDLNTTKAPWRCFNVIQTKNRSDYYFPNWLYFDLTVWISEKDMNQEEKNNNPYYNVIGGYIKVFSYKEAAQLSYNKATKEEQRSIEDLPNYTHELLYEIFGIDRTEDKRLSN